MFCIERKKTLIEQCIDRERTGAVYHEFGAGFAKNGRRFIDELARLQFDTQVDAAFWVGQTRSTPEWSTSLGDLGCGAILCHGDNIIDCIYIVNTMPLAIRSKGLFLRKPNPPPFQGRGVGVGARDCAPKDVKPFRGIEPIQVYPTLTSLP